VCEGRRRCISNPASAPGRSRCLHLRGWKLCRDRFRHRHHRNWKYVHYLRVSEGVLQSPVCVCLSVCLHSRTRTSNMTLSRQGQEVTLEVVKFWCWSDSRFGSRITCPLPLALWGRSFYDSLEHSHTAICRFSPNLVRLFTPPGELVQYILALSWILISPDVWIRFWIPDDFVLY